MTIKRRTVLQRCFAISVILATGTSSSAQQICPPGTPSGPVQAPVFVTNLAGQTSWFASPVVYDLDGNGSNELVAAYYDIYVFASDGTLLHRAQDGSGGPQRSGQADPRWRGVIFIDGFESGTAGRWSWIGPG